MFSGLRSLVEDLAQPQPRPARTGRSDSQEFSPERPASVSRSSFDLSTAGKTVAHSTGHLAESALSNLRKSLASQRPFTLSSPDGRSSPKLDRELRPVSKPTLEDRLRASFAIGEASNTTTPEGLSHAPTPKPAPIPERVLSPKSTPLPESPLQSPSLERIAVSPPPNLDGSLSKGQSYFDPLQVAPRVPEERPRNVDRKEGGIVAEQDDVVEGKRENESQEAENIDKTTVSASTEEGKSKTAIAAQIAVTADTTSRYPEADVPLPPLSPEPTNLAASQSYRSPSLDDTSQSLEPDGDNDNLKRRINSLELRLLEVTASLEQLKASHDSANAILGEFTPVKNISDAVALRDHLQKMNNDHNTSQDEVKRLQNRLRTYDERIEELRDTHRLESRSQSELVNNLRRQLEEAEALLKAAERSNGQVDEETRKRQEEMDQLKAEAQKLKDVAKEEEEKRVKAISLLKTVRQKLVKAEKERDEAVKESQGFKEAEKAEREKEKTERLRLEKEVESVRAEKERDIAGLKAHFDRELETVKDRLEKEFLGRKGQLELEVMSMKATHQKEISAKNTRIQTLESSVRSLSNERDNLFEQLQLRQAELESSQSHLESLESSTSELRYQLRELTDRNAVLAEELADARRELEYREARPSISSEESSRAHAALVIKYEAKLAELSSQLANAEKERSEGEAALSRTLQQKTQENDELRKIIDSTTQTKGISEEEVAKLKQEIEVLQRQVVSYEEQLLEVERGRERISGLENLLKKQTDDFNARTQQFEKEVQEAREREAQIKATNKTLREELRKVQNSAALLERQRNPGVGYWSNLARHDNQSEARLASPPPSSSGSGSLSRATSPPPAKNDEEVNLEYLRNVILQFLEHKEMRPHLVRVLSIILHFTPQETRRLVAKVT